MPIRTFVIIGLSLACLSQSARAGDWPQFRGPNNSGLPIGTGLPQEWSADKNVQWKVAIPGAAWSCPIVSGDRVFVTTAISENQQKPKPGGFGPRPGGGGGGGGPDGAGPRRRPGGGNPDGNSDSAPDGAPERRGQRRGGFGGGGGTPPDVTYRWEVHCLDRLTGKLLWKQDAGENKPTISIHRTNTYASETPVTDGEHVYAYFGMHGLYCFDVNGKLVWKKDLPSFPMMNGWGTGSSPALDGDRLFIQCDNEKASFLLALDKRTGKELWRAERDERSSWSTPFVWHTPGRTEVVACGGNRVLSYAVADGKILWELGGIGARCSATPVAGEDLLYLGAGGPNSSSPLFAIKAGASGDITLAEGATSNAGIVWSRSKSGPAMASPLLYEGYLYVLEQRGGMVSCFNAKTGEPAYFRQRIEGSGGFTASPWASDGKIFCLDEQGQTSVLKAGPEFELLGQNKIGEMCWSTPAFADGALLLRSIDNLYSIK